MWPHQLWIKGRDPLPQAPGNTWSDTAEHSLHLLCSKGTLLAHVQLGVYQSPRSFSVKLFSIWVSSSKSWCLCMSVYTPEVILLTWREAQTPWNAVVKFPSYFFLTVTGARIPSLCLSHTVFNENPH